MQEARDLFIETGHAFRELFGKVQKAVQSPDPTDALMEALDTAMLWVGPRKSDPTGKTLAQLWEEAGQSSADLAAIPERKRTAMPGTQPIQYRIQDLAAMLTIAAEKAKSIRAELRKDHDNALENALDLPTGLNPPPRAVEEFCEAAQCIFRAADLLNINDLNPR